MSATNEAPGWTSQFRELIGAIDAISTTRQTGPICSTQTTMAHRKSSVPAPRRRIEWHHLAQPSLPGGQCIAVFWPDVIPIPTQGAHSPTTGTGQRWIS